MLVIFENAGEKIPNKEHNIIIKAAGISLLNRRIIFINDDNRFCSMILMQHFGQHHQGQHKLIAGGLAGDHLMEEILIGIRIRVKLRMALVLNNDQLRDQIISHP